MNLFGENIEEIALERIRYFLQSEPAYYVTNSYGKDSAVIAYLVKKAKVPHDFHFNYTTVDAPEVMRFGRQFYPEVRIHRPEKTMFQLIPVHRMPPTRIVRYCCEHLKEYGGIGRRVITGVRWDESRNRKEKRKLFEYWKDKTVLNPIIDWSNEDVWSFIKYYDLPRNPLYSQGYSRIGCICCPMAGQDRMKQDAARWPRFQKAYISAFQKMVEWRIRDNMSCDWKNGYDVWDWLVSDHHHKSGDPDQTCFIFE